jgi:hypothetical protein
VDGVQAFSQHVARLTYQVTNHNMFDKPYPDNLRKIVYKHSAKTWTASLLGARTEIDGRIHQDPDIKITASSFDELLSKLQKEPATNVTGKVRNGSEVEQE